MKKYLCSRYLVTIASIVAIIILAIGIWTYKICTDGIPVLNYHQVNDKDLNALTVSTKAFDEQMQYLHDNNYTTISPKELYEYIVHGEELPEKPILITFDDGYKDNYENAFPILKKYDQKATIFIITDFVGQYEKYLDWADVNIMSDYGIYMGSHTLSHENLAELSSKDVYYQLHTSRAVLEWRTQKPAEFLAFPCGAFNDDTLEQARKAGYKGGFTVRYDLAKKGDNPFDLNRVPVFGHPHSKHELLRFWARLKFAPIFGEIERFKEKLYGTKWAFVAEFIPSP